MNPNSKPEPDDVTLTKIFEAYIDHSFLYCLYKYFYLRWKDYIKKQVK